MRTNLITSRETDLEVNRYAAERGLRTYSAMNELLKIGIGYYRLFGSLSCKHEWHGYDDRFECTLCHCVQVKE